MQKIFDGLSFFNDWTARAGAIFIVAIMTVAVFMRYIIGAPLQWVEEVLITLFIWMIMLGSVSAMRVRAHVSIDAFTSMLSLGTQRMVFIMNDCIAIAVLCSLGWLGLELAMEAGDKITPILQIPYTFIDLAVPVGCFWMAAHVARHLRDDLRGDAFNRKAKENRS